MQAKSELDQKVPANNRWRLGPVMGSTNKSRVWCCTLCDPPPQAAAATNSQPSTHLKSEVS